MEEQVPDREDLLTRIASQTRRHYAAYALFYQTMADRLGLHMTDLQCIGLLDLEHEPVSTSEVAKLTGLTPGSATRLIDRLEKLGLVVRKADAQDRRKSLVAMAPGARAQLAEAWAAPWQRFTEALADYTDDELALIGRYLARVTETSLETTAGLTSGALAVTRFHA
ncbi:MAG TPA: MarR family transcriptional regulator [Pseudonocardia sp.]|nr:MarR family transcriptional regulator [Pseudonocardia sp.]